MEHVSKPRVKICCISSVEEAEMAVRFGASALGLVSEMPSGPSKWDHTDWISAAVCGRMESWTKTN